MQVVFVQCEYGVVMCTEATRHSLELGAVPRSVSGTSEMGSPWNIFFKKIAALKKEINKKPMTRTRKDCWYLPALLSFAFNADRSQTPWVQSSWVFCLRSVVKGQRSHDAVEQAAT